VAIRSGQRSIEHIRDALLVCFTSDASELDRFFTADGWSEHDKEWGRAANSSCSSIIQAMHAHEAWLTPTLTVEKAKVSVEDASHRNDKRRGALPQSVRDAYEAYAKRKMAQAPVERASERLWWRTQQKLVARMNRERVRLLAGTDAACEGGLPGYSLHSELEELVAAGLSPLASVRAATLEPASYFKRKAEGEVLAGYRANLLLLDANPLTNIENTRHIHAVVLDGKLLDRRELNRLLRKHRLHG
jgi:imidazolonepropionase-like amidohydrolase